MSILKVTNLFKKFGGLHAVDHLSFEVKRGTITGLIGPNGAGKTTAFNLITHFLPRNSGKIFYKKNDLKRFRAHVLVRKGISRTFQQIRLWPNLTIKENLLLACSHQYDQWWKSFRRQDENEALKKIKKLLQTVKLEKFLDEKAETLSYGQTKLIEILRTILTDAELILLDEPAAGVNPTMLREVEKLIFELKKSGKTLFIIEHNMPFLMRISDEIIVMEGGKFLCQDIPEKIQKDQRVLEAYLGA